jgi:hypothetical protein
MIAFIAQVVWGFLEGGAGVGLKISWEAGRVQGLAHSTGTGPPSRLSKKSEKAFM